MLQNHMVVLIALDGRYMEEASDMLFVEIYANWGWGSSFCHR